MLLVDLLQQMSRAQRALPAHRWGVEPDAAAMVAERLVSSAIARRSVSISPSTTLSAWRFLALAKAKSAGNPVRMRA